MALKANSVAGRILHNSFWYGLESIIETVIFMGTSIAVGRYFGPEKLGHFTYINFFVTVVTRTSGTGLANATRKYMSEFLAVDRPGVARSVYYMAYKYQLIGTLLITVLGLAAVYLFGDPTYRLMSVLLILSILPGVMSWVPANANQAFEDVSQNTFSAFCYIFTYTTMIILTLTLGWGLAGIAAALLVGRTVEVILRTIPLHRRLSRMPIEPLDATIVARIRKFCLEAIGVQILMSVVWDRSEMIFLGRYSTYDQIGFYSVSVTLANNLLVFPRIFTSATGITLMVESGREPGRVDGIVRNAARYLLLVVFPIHLGAAAITKSVIGVTYGAKYAGAVPALVIATILAIPRAFQEIPEVLMRAADKQKQLLIWLSITGVVNMGLDWALIPRYGAVGAAWGNGLGQAFGIVAIWIQARRFYDFGFPVSTALRFCASGLIMGGAAWWVGHTIPGILGIVAAILTAIPTYVVFVKLFQGLQASDRERLAPIGNRLPGAIGKAYRAAIQFATPAA